MKFARAACVALLLSSGPLGQRQAAAEPTDDKPAVKESAGAAGKSKRSSSASGRTKKLPAKEKQSDAPQPLAGPGSEHPQRPFPLWWSDGEAAQLWPLAMEAYGQAFKHVVALERSNDSKKSKGQLADFGRAHVALLQVERLTERIAMWSEPAGIELRLRGHELNRRLQALYMGLRTQHEELIQANRPSFVDRCRKQEKQLEKIRRIFAEGNLAEAESRLHKIYDELAVVGVWYSTSTQTKPMPAAFEDLMQDIKGPLNSQRQKAAAEAIAERRMQLAPNFAALLADINAAGNAIGVEGQVDIAGKKLNGPQALAGFLTRWRQTQAAAMQARAVDWARFSGGGRAAIEKFNMQHAVFTRDIAAALARLISSDAGQIDVTQAERRYGEYLEVLAPTVSLAADSKIAAALESALSDLAKKSPALTIKIAGYQAATSDALRWRERLAVAEAQHARGNRHPLDLPPNCQAQLVCPVADMIPEISKTLLKPGVWKNLVGSRESRVATGGYDVARIYPSVELDLGTLAPVSTELRKLLLVGDGLPPLTLEAAIALVQTDRGDLAEVGGDVESFEVDALLPMFANWTTPDWGPVKLDRLSDEVFGETGQRGDPLNELRFRLIVRPSWVRQHYAFVRLREE